MTDKEFLQKAKDFLEKGWTKGVMARDSRCREIHAGSESATCWCILGALCATRESLKSTWTQQFTVERILERELSKMGHCEIADFNDALMRTKEEVLALLDKAIEAAQ